MDVETSKEIKKKKEGETGKTRGLLWLIGPAAKHPLAPERAALCHTIIDKSVTSVLRLPFHQPHNNVVVVVRWKKVSIGKRTLGHPIIMEQFPPCLVAVFTPSLSRFHSGNPSPAAAR